MKKLIWLVAIVVVLVGAWGLAFGTYDPCAAMRNEAERVATETGGSDGKAIRELLKSKQAPSSTFACVQMAFSLKVRGRDAIVILRK